MKGHETIRVPIVKRVTVFALVTIVGTALANFPAFRGLATVIVGVTAGIGGWWFAKGDSRAPVVLAVTGLLAGVRPPYALGVSPIRALLVLFAVGYCLGVIILKRGSHIRFNQFCFSLLGLCALMSITWSRDQVEATRWFLSLAGPLTLALLASSQRCKKASLAAFCETSLWAAGVAAGIALFHGNVYEQVYRYQDLVRQSGVYFDPNFFGAYLASALPFGLAPIVGTTAGKFRMLPTAFIVAAIFSTLSRTALLSALAGAACVLLFSVQRRPGMRRRFSDIIVMVTVLIVLYQVLPVKGFLGATINRLREPDLVSLNSRVAIWREGMSLWKSHPLVGVGIAQFHVVVGRFAHNTFLEFLVEFGMFGFVVFLAFVISTVFTGFRCTSTVGAAPLASLISLLVSANALSMQFSEVFWLGFVLVEWSRDVHAHELYTCSRTQAVPPREREASGTPHDVAGVPDERVAALWGH